MRQSFRFLCHHLTSSRSFVIETLQKYPDLCFSDILSIWCSQHLLTNLSTFYNNNENNNSTEVYDTAEIQLLNKMYEDPMPAHNSLFLRNYSTAHFAAELGNISILNFLFSQGIILHALSNNITINDTNYLKKKSRIPLETVVLSIPDSEGRYISHIAAQYGHLNFLKYLVECFDVKKILGERISISEKKSKASSLNVYEIAFVYGHIPILEWIDSSHVMYSFNPIEKNAIWCLQRAAYHGQINSLKYFLQRHGKDSQIPLKETLYPAAEGGAENVLNFLIENFGNDIVWRPNDIGATPLHYAARFGRTNLLDEFFLQYNLKEHIDDKDESGRTPAMWCVMGNKKTRNIEFLKRLLDLGSKWPNDIDNEGQNIELLAQMRHSSSSRIYKFITKCVKSAQH